MMRLAVPSLALALMLGLASGPSQAATLGPAMPPSEAIADAAWGAPVMLARCGSKCQAKRRAWRRHYRPHRPHRPHRPPHYRPRPHYPHYYRDRRGDGAAGAIIGGIIGLGIGAAIANSNPDYYGDDYAPEFADPGGDR